MANFPMLDAVLGYIEAHPDQHDQTVFGYSNACWTTACVAGHAVLMSGSETEWLEGESDKFKRIMIRANVDGHWLPIFGAGQKILDLTDEQAKELFYCWDNNIDTLKGIVKGWANEQ